MSGTGTSGWFSNVIWCDKFSSVIVNVLISVLCLYPAGALTSSTVYVPLSKSVKTYGSVVDVNCATVEPAESFTSNILLEKYGFEPSHAPYYIVLRFDNSRPIPYKQLPNLKKSGNTYIAKIKPLSDFMGIK